MDIQTLQVSFKLPVVTQKDGDYIVSSCPALDVFSQGSDEKEAIDNLLEALKLFLETCYEMGTLNEVLKECGFKPSREKRGGLATEHLYLDVPVSFSQSRENAQACAH